MCWYVHSMQIPSMLTLTPAHPHTRTPAHPHPHSSRADRNAIRVESVAHQMVGHISAKCGTAGTLAPIADHALAGGAGGLLEAECAGGAEAKYSSQAAVTVVGRLEHHPAIAAHLRRKGVFHYDCVENRFVGDPGSPRAKSGVSLSLQGTLAGGVLPKVAKGAAAVAPPANQRVLSEAEVLKSLDCIWEERESAQSDLHFDPADHEGVRACLLLTLLPYQRQGVAFMLQREVDAIQQLPPLYSEEPGSSSSSSSATKYLHELTRHSYVQRPPPLLGGALCDDMGLGAY
jgi:hypothetical protein